MISNIMLYLSKTNVRNSS